MLLLCVYESLLLRVRSGNVCTSKTPFASNMSSTMFPGLLSCSKGFIYRSKISKRETSVLEIALVRCVCFDSSTKYSPQYGGE